MAAFSTTSPAAAYLPGLRALQIDPDYYGVFLHNLSACAISRFRHRNRRHRVGAAQATSHDLRAIAHFWLMRERRGCKFWGDSQKYLVVTESHEDENGEKIPVRFLSWKRDQSTIRAGITTLLKVMRAEYAGRGVLSFTTDPNFAVGSDNDDDDSDSEEGEEEEEDGGVSLPAGVATYGTMTLPVRGSVDNPGFGGQKPSVDKYRTLAIREK